LFFHSLRTEEEAIDLFANIAAILNSVVSNIYYGMLRGAN